MDQSNHPLQEVLRLRLLAGSAAEQPIGDLPPLPWDLDTTNPRLNIPLKVGELVTALHRWGHEVYLAGQSQATRAQAEPVDQGHVLRTLRSLLDGSHPKDIAGALAVIDNALKTGIAWSYDIAPPSGFISYVKENYTGDVHFHDPEWHAVRLWNAAMKNVGARLTPAAQEVTQQAAQDAERDLCLALLACPHAMDEHRVLLYRNGSKEGGAYAQIADRLREAFSKLAPTTSTVSAGTCLRCEGRGTYAVMDDNTRAVGNIRCAECNGTGQSVPQAWREFARAIRDLPVGAEPNLDGMRAKARQLLANEERRVQEGGGT